MKQQFLVVKDEEGIIRPQAGCWNKTPMGEASAEIYQKKNKDITIVVINVEEV